MQGYIFDFNGTMFFDSTKHDCAWRQYLVKRIGREVSREEFMEYAYGRPNQTILKHFFGRALSEEERLHAVTEKEAMYRRLCMEDRQGLHLAKGLPKLLDKWKAEEIPMAIATAANRDNMEFYFEAFDLKRWFSWDYIVLDDGTLKGKPEPDYYLRASALLHMIPADCHVFEDSLSGVLAAHRAGVGRITAVYGDSDEGLLKEQGIADDYISDFSEYVD